MESRRDFLSSINLPARNPPIRPLLVCGPVSAWANILQDQLVQNLHKDKNSCEMDGLYEWSISDVLSTGKLGKADARAGLFLRCDGRGSMNRETKARLQRNNHCGANFDSQMRQMSD
ncbi:hypothetical protein CLAIMM_05777 [Cladophialophora immunda]|nr:hypothetical protein CLAIMM_05777 [Cladophialophora immunda]